MDAIAADSLLKYSSHLCKCLVFIDDHLLSLLPARRSNSGLTLSLPGRRYVRRMFGHNFTQKDRYVATNGHLFDARLVLPFEPSLKTTEEPRVSVTRDWMAEKIVNPAAAQVALTSFFAAELAVNLAANWSASFLCDIWFVR